MRKVISTYVSVDSCWFGRNAHDVSAGDRGVPRSTIDEVRPLEQT